MSAETEYLAIVSTQILDSTAAGRVLLTASTVVDQRNDLGASGGVWPESLGGLGTSTFFDWRKAMLGPQWYQYYQRWTDFGQRLFTTVTAECIGSCGWRAFALSGTPTFTVPDAPPGNTQLPGYVTVTTGASSNNDAVMAMGNAVHSELTGMNGIAPWEFQFPLYVNRITNIHFRCGLLFFPVSSVTGDQISFTFSTASGNTTIQCLCKDGSGSTTGDTTVTLAATTYYKLRIWSAVAGTIKFRVYSAANVALGVEVTLAANVPTGGLVPTVYVQSLTTSAAVFRAWGSDYGLAKLY